MQIDFKNLLFALLVLLVVYNGLVGYHMNEKCPQLKTKLKSCADSVKACSGDLDYNQRLVSGLAAIAAAWGSLMVMRML